MLKIFYLNKFKKDYKRIVKRGYNVRLLEEVLELLKNEETLPGKYKDHSLTGKYKKYRECHIASDWLLIYEIRKKELVLILSRTGTHSDLF